MALDPGTRLGPYEVLAPLGVGGMGEVYKARDTRLDRTVALKILPPEFSSDPARRARFAREAKTISQLNHPHICVLHDIGEVVAQAFRPAAATQPASATVSYLVMEYLEGQTLAQRLAKGRLPLDEALRFGAEIADALAAAHGHGVIHRDLKPSNIMLTRSSGSSSPPTVKLLDFGLAKPRDVQEPVPIDETVPTATASLTRAGEVLGTRPYMAPEQVEGNPADARTDIWALGCVLYEMVTGRRTFSGGSEARVTAAILDREPPPLTSLQPLTPPSLERLVAMCLAKRPEDRSNSADGVALQLRRIAQSQEHGRVARAVQIRSRRLLFATSAPVAVLALSFGLLDLLRRETSVRVPPGTLSLAVLPLSDRSVDGSQAAWCHGIAETLIDSLGKVQGLNVRGRQSSFGFTADDEVPGVGRRLNVTHLLTGTLQRSGRRLRISIRLISAAEAVEVWSEVFDGDAQDIFDIQDRIAASVVMKLNVALAQGEPSNIQRRYTNNATAYDLYLMGRKVQSQRTADGHRRAIAIFREAVAEDPDFALPYVALADIYANLYVSDRAVPRGEGYSQSKSALAKALSLDRDNVRALAIRASLKSGFENDLVGAAQDFERALQLSPRDPDVLETHNLFLIQRGRLDEALTELNLLVSIDPAVAQNYFYRGRLYYYLHQYEESVAEYEKALQLDPDHLNTLEWSVLTYLAQGLNEKAVERCAQIEPLDPEWAAAGRAWIEASGGNRLKAERDFVYVGHGSWMSAVHHAALGNRSAALADLTRVADENRGALSFCFLTHVFDRYRSDPEFVGLLERSGFEFRPGAENRR